MQHKGAHSLKDRRNLLIFGVLLHLFVGIACQDCFRFYRPDTFQIWRIPKGSGLCNLNSYDGCPNNAVALISNASNGTFAFYKCTSFEDGASDMTKSYATGPEQAILVNFGNGQSSSLKPIRFKEVSNPTNTSNLYNSTVENNDTGFARSLTTMAIRSGDIVTENTSARSIFEILTMLVFLGVIFTFMINQQYLSFVSVGYCVFYASMVTALHLCEMEFIVMLLCLIACLALGWAAGYFVHRAGGNNYRFATFTSIIVNVIFFFVMLFIPADAVAKVFMIFISVVNLVSLLICLYCKRRHPDPETNQIHKLKMLESSVLGTTLCGVCLYSLNVSMSYTFRRYNDLSSNYPTEQGIGKFFGNIFTNLVALCVMGALSTTITNRIPLSRAFQSKIPILPTAEAAYGVYTHPQYL